MVRDTEGLQGAHEEAVCLVEGRYSSQVAPTDVSRSQLLGETSMVQVVHK